MENLINSFLETKFGNKLRIKTRYITEGIKCVEYTISSGYDDILTVYMYPEIPTKGYKVFGSLAKEIEIWFDIKFRGKVEEIVFSWCKSKIDFNNKNLEYYVSLENNI
jgi:hypothetical protein